VSSLEIKNVIKKLKLMIIYSTISCTNINEGMHLLKLLNVLK